MTRNVNSQIAFKSEHNFLILTNNKSGPQLNLPKKMYEKITNIHFALTIPTGKCRENLTKFQGEGVI